MDYIGEHLLPGQLGHFLIVLSLVASLLAAFSYYKATNAILVDEHNRWKKLGRIAFGLDVAAVIGVFIIILYIVSAHRFEYFYAWNHSSKSLNFKYLLSCIWEGQEGSFLLWAFWHAVLGTIIAVKGGKWEAPVMTVISFAQFCLATMIIGLYFGDARVGSNPFLLVREHFSDAPVFNSPDYLNIPQMQDGQGLNQLLQNYWMVIHPPVLFLGFASTIVPFAYAIAGLWKKDFGGWTKEALPWSLFSAAALGTGIMMGAAWAYESLTFGGFWAWDPVENASLVPWLILIAGIHTQVIFNATGYSLRATYIFFLLSFIFILYSTFLTRSGVLGDSSVHAFTDQGMNFQLLMFIVVFLLPAAYLVIRNFRKIPHIAKEENTYSREFWMFIGSLVLFLSAMVITWQTSFTPIYNKLTGKASAAPEDPEFAYNKIQVFVAIVLGVLTAATQYLKYKNTPKKYFLGKIALPTIIALVLSLTISLIGGIHYDKQGPGFTGALHVALFAAVYSVVANIGYIWAGMNGKLKAAGASVAHVGFGLMLVGIIIAASNKKVLSINTTGINLQFDPKSKEKSLENLTLIKGIPTDMGSYMATYENSDSTTQDGNIMHFKINFKGKDGKENFDLYPNLIKNTKGQQGYSNNPDARHYWNKDIFTYISYADNMDRDEDTAGFRSHAVDVKDTVFYSNGYFIVNKVEPNPFNDKYTFTAQDTALMADITVYSNDNAQYTARPAFYISNNESKYVLDTVFAQNLAIGFSRVLDDHKIELQVKESTKMVPYVALKVYEFPHINVLWLGTILMIVGFVMSIIRRVQLNRTLKVV